MSHFPLSRRAIERIAENKIREAREQGMFDDLPGAGRPLPDIDGTYDPLWWVRGWIRRERLIEEPPPMDPGRWRAMLVSTMRAWLPGERR